MLMLPSLIRLFAASENVVALIPRTQADVDAAQQQTNYINYVFWQDNPGFLILYGAFKDAMTVRTGYVKWWTDDHKEKRRKTLHQPQPQQVQLLHAQDPTAKVVQQGKPDPQTGTYRRGRVRIPGRQADHQSHGRAAGGDAARPLRPQLRNLAHRRPRAGRRRSMNSSPWATSASNASNYLQSQDIQNFTMESQLRNPGRYNSTRVGDGVLYGEWYIKVDGDGDGIAELRYICTMGEDLRHRP